MAKETRPIDKKGFSNKFFEELDKEHDNAKNLANAVGIPTDSMCFTCSTGNYEPLGIAPTFKSRKEMKGD